MRVTMHSIVSAVAVLGLVVSARAADARPKHVHESAKPAVAQPQGSVADLVGLTSDEIRTRFGVSRVLENRVSQAWVDGDKLMTAIQIAGSSESCPNRGTALLDDSPTPGYPWAEFLFADGRLADVRTNGVRGIDGVKEIILRCDRSSRGEVDPFAYALVAPFMPAVLVHDAQVTSRQRAFFAAFTAFRLGEPPAAGIDAVTKAPGGSVTVIPGADGGSDIKLTFKGGYYPPAQVTVRDGRVTAIVAPFGGACVLGEDRAMHC